VISGWGKANSLPADGSNSNFALQAYVVYAGDSTQTFSFSFNWQYEGWQYLSGSFTTAPDKYVRQIDIRCVYNYNRGEACFDQISLVRGSGLYTAYTYDEKGNLTGTASSNGTSVSYAYSGDNPYPVGYTTAIDSEYDLSYDASYNLESVVSQYNSPGSPVKTELQNENEYNDMGQLVETITSYLYLSAEGWLESNQQIRSGYTYYTDTLYQGGLFGYVTSYENEAGQETHYGYDQRGRVAYVLYPDDSALGYTYDEYGNRSSVRGGSVANGIFYPDYSQPSVVYAYDLTQRLYSITTSSTRYVFLYDTFGNITSIHAGNDTLATYTYQPNNGKLLSVTYGNGFSESYTYDALGRVVGIQHSADGAVLYEYAYNSEGHLVSYRDYESGRLCEYAYDAITGALLHQVLKNTEDGATAEVISVVSYLYDDYGRQVGRTVDSYGFLNEDVAYAAVYEAGTGNLIAYQIGADKAFSYTYDGFYRLTEKVLQAEAFSYEQSYTYQSFTGSTGQRTNYRISSFNNTVMTNADVATYDTESSYTYDAMGNITSVHILDVLTQQTKDIFYSYDDNGQLLREDNQQLGRTYVYTYDSAGNILSKSIYPYTRAVNPTAPLQTIDYGYIPSSYGWGDLLVSYDGQAIDTYDGMGTSIGNPWLYIDYELTWENGRQLTGVQDRFGDVAAYEYNGDGIRIAKVVDGIRYEYTLDGTQIQAIAYEKQETAGGQTDTVYYLLQFTYDESGAPVSMRYIECMNRNLTDYRVDQTYYYVKNLQGDVVALTNAAGSVVATYTYDAWGNQTVGWSSGQEWVAEMNPFRYRGYFYDTETGFYYLNSRYYDPEVGRFLNADTYINPTGEMIGYNMYAYCVKNPVNWVDHSGTVPAVAAAIPAGIGLVLFCAAVAVISSKDFQDVWDDTTEDIMDGIETIGDAINSLFDKPTPEEVPDTSPDAPSTDGKLPNQGEVSEIPDAPPVNAGKQGQHVPGHNNDNDPKKSKWKPGENGVRQTQEAWQNGKEVPRRQGKIRIGQSSDGRTIKVHIDGSGTIHGYPIFP